MGRSHSEGHGRDIAMVAGIAAAILLAAFTVAATMFATGMLG